MTPTDMTQTDTVQTDTPQIASIYRYPVKGLTPERLDAVTLRPGETVPYDRAFAIENGPGRFDPENPAHLPKINFLMLMRDERLAMLETKFDDDSKTLTIKRDGKQVARGALDTPIGRQMIEQFVAAFMSEELRGAPRIVQAPGHSFSDKREHCIHLVNLASIAELERAGGKQIDPLRFRANLYIEGARAWTEFDWVDKKLQIGAATLNVFARTQRCPATNVDPATGTRDMSIPALLERNWGHADFGIYAMVEAGGEITPGATIQIT